MAIERERKFLPDPNDTSLRRRMDAVPPEARREISQGYLISADDLGELRLREVRIGNEVTRVLAVKRGSTERRLEIECPVSASQWDALWPGTAGNRIVKTRYLLTVDDRVVEVDRFHQPNAGLILIEVEFPSDDEAARFTPPEWFGREVTRDRRYRNQYLATEAPTSES